MVSVAVPISAAAQSPPSMPFPSMLKHLRMRNHVSQCGLARIAGCDHSYISRLEKGVRQPTRDAIEGFARALGLSCLDHDQLLISAGFVPDGAVVLRDPEPTLVCIDRWLKDPSVPAAQKERLVTMLKLMLPTAAG